MKQSVVSIDDNSNLENCVKNSSIMEIQYFKAKLEQNRTVEESIFSETHTKLLKNEAQS